MGLLNTLVKWLFHIDIEAITKENESLKDSFSEEQQASKRKDLRLSQMETETKSLRREVANLKSRKTLLEGEVSTLKHKLAKSNGDSNSEEHEYRYTIAKIESWRVQNEEANDKIEKLQNELVSAHREYKKVTKQLTVLQSRYNSVKSELDALRHGQSSDVIALQSECTRLSDRLAVITSDRDRLSEQIKILFEDKSSKHISPETEYNEKRNTVNPISLIIESIRQDKIIKNQRIAEIVKALMDKKEADANSNCGISQIIDTVHQAKIIRNKKIAEIISTLETRGDTEIPNVISEHIPDTAEVLSQYDKVEVLPNNLTLYSDGEDWYLLGIDDPLASYNNNDEVKTTILSDKYQIYNLSIKKNVFIGQKPIEYYFFEDKIFKFDKSSRIWTLWYSNDEILSSSSDDINVTDDNQLKLIKEDTVLYIDSDGTISEEAYMDEPEYLEQIPLKNGYFIVKLIDGYWGIVDDENNYAVLAQYNMISPINGKYLRFQAGNKWGVMSIEGDVLIDAKYNSIESYSDGGFVVTKVDPSQLDEITTEKIDL